MVYISVYTLYNIGVQMEAMLKGERDVSLRKERQSPAFVTEYRSRVEHVLKRTSAYVVIPHEEDVLYPHLRTKV